MKRPVSILFLFSLCFSLQSQTAQPRLAHFEKVASYSKEDIIAVWKKYHIPRSFTPVKYGVDVYDVMYCSSWINGQCISASGLYFVPVGMKGPKAMVSYNHGTQIRKERKVELAGEQALCIGLATDGYVVCFPDYIGLGKGDGFHLYQHSESEAQASIDMMRAARELNNQIGIELSGQLFLTGYSQGGHAAMSLHKILQERYADEFPVTASSPMSGAYDLAGVQSEVMFQTYSHPGYLPYLMNSYQEVYHMMPGNIFQAFQSPYDTLLPPLFDGNHGMGDINKVLPPVPKDAMRKEVVEMFEKDPEFKFVQALKENSVFDWKPERPVQICYCRADEQVSYKNAIVAYNAMKVRGAENVTLRESGKRFGHGTCALFSGLYTKMYFDSFRKGSKHGRKGPIVRRTMIEVGKRAFKH